MDQEEGQGEDRGGEKEHPNAGRVKAIIESIDDELKEEYLFWRLITEQTATAEELNRSYSYTDMMKANAILDMKDRITSLLMQPEEDK